MADKMEHSKVDRAQVGWGFWLKWVLASIVGWILSVSLSMALSLPMSGATFGAVIGAAVGTAQWLVLRRQVSRASLWILVSTVGWAVGTAVADDVFVALSPKNDAVFRVVLATNFVIGASVGIAQWLVLRQQVSQAGWWMLVSAISQTMGMAVAGLTVDSLLFAILGMAAWGGITGGALV